MGAMMPDAPAVEMKPEPKQPSPPELVADEPEPENEDDMSATTDALLRELLAKMDRQNTTAPPAPSLAQPVTMKEGRPLMSEDEEAMYGRFKLRLLAELPAISTGVTITVTPPEKLRKDFQREETSRILASASGLKTLSKRILKFVEGVGGYTSQREIAKRLGRSMGGGPMSDMSRAVKELAELGFVENSANQGVGKSLRARIASDLASYQPTEAEVEAVYQNGRCWRCLRIDSRAEHTPRKLWEGRESDGRTKRRLVTNDGGGAASIATTPTRTETQAIGRCGRRWRNRRRDQSAHS
jgi:hypothetical protein